MKRKSSSYLLETLESLLKSMNATEKNQSLIVVSIGETDLDYVNSVAGQIRGNFTEDFLSGLIEVIAPNSHYYYPRLENLKINFGDSIERVRWRSKENLDAIFLMNYAKIKGKYFLMVEDDVKTRPGFIAKAQEFIKLSDNETHQNPWFMLKLCKLGTVATLFRASDVSKISNYLELFYDSKPIDWLFEDFLDTKYCAWGWKKEKCTKEKENHKRVMKSSLFQHIGTTSSLDGKKQPLKDKTFE